MSLPVDFLDDLAKLIRGLEAAEHELQYVVLQSPIVVVLGEDPDSVIGELESVDGIWQFTPPEPEGVEAIDQGTSP